MEQKKKERRKLDRSDAKNLITTKLIAQAAIIAALYAALTVLIMPASYGVMQLRISEALTVLPVFTPAAIPGLFVGCVVANLMSPVGPIDVVIGSAATLIAAVATYLLRDHRLLALLAPVVTNAVMVGAELCYFYKVGLPLPVCMFWVGLGEAAACYVLGYPLSLFLDKKKKIFE